MGPLTVADVLTPGTLEYRERYLRAQAFEHPAAIAQQVRFQLVQICLRDSPWLIPMVMDVRPSRKQTAVAARG